MTYFIGMGSDNGEIAIVIVIFKNFFVPEIDIVEGRYVREIEDDDNSDADVVVSLVEVTEDWITGGVPDMYFAFFVKNF